MKDKPLDSKKKLEHILEAIVTIEKFSKNEDSVSFCENEMLNNSILLQFLIIGEKNFNMPTLHFNHLEAYNLQIGLLINFGETSLNFKRLTNKKFKSPESQISNKS